MLSIFPFSMSQSSVNFIGSNERRKKDTEKNDFQIIQYVFCLFVRGSSELLDEEKIVIMGPD